jgi:hypothetical protein
MKKIFLFALLGLSLNAFSQGKPTVPNGQVPFKYTIKNSIQERLEKMRNPFGLRSENIFNSMIHHEAMMFPPPVQLVDSVYNWAWDTLSGEWLTKRRTIDIAYDGRNNPISYTEQKWQSLMWNNYTRTNLTYDASNNLIQEVVQEWKNDAWKNSYNETYTYDEHNNQTSSATQVWSSDKWYNQNKTIITFDSLNNLTSRTNQDGSGDIWINSFQELYTYDSLGNLTLEVSRFWYQNLNDWKDNTQVIYTYDSHSNRITELEQEWEINDWINVDIYVYTYDSNDSLIHSIYKGWYSGELENYRQTFYTYDVEHQQNIRTYQEWVGDDWKNGSRYIDTYDSDNNVIGTLIQLWNDTSDTWENYSQTMYTFGANKNLTSLTNYIWDWQASKCLKSSQGVIGYDDDGFLMYHVGKSFNEDGVTIQDADSTHIYYHIVIVSDEKVAVNQQVEIWPNPSSGEVTFSSPLENGILNISVFDMNGRLVHSIKGVHRNIYSMKTGDLSPGIYIVQLQFDQGVTTRQIVVQ